MNSKIGKLILTFEYTNLQMKKMKKINMYIIYLTFDINLISHAISKYHRNNKKIGISV
jgi:hypothetical protein